MAVDDDPFQLAVVASALRSTGFRVVPVRDPATVLEACRREPCDAVLLDIEMPGLDGYEVCRRLKADPATSDIPVLFMTAHGSDEAVIRGLDAGASDYVTKPANPKILAQRLSISIRARQAEQAQRQLAEERAAALAALAEAHMQELELRKARGLATMAGGLAHEINNPLSAALSAIQSVRSGGLMPDETPEAVLDEATTMLERIAAIIGRMRSLTDKTSGGRAAPLQDIATLVVEPRRAALAERQIRLDTRIEVTPPIRGAHRMTEVISELLDNAARALRPGGRLEVSLTSEASGVILVVSDDGTGISPAALEHVFDPFYTSKTEWRTIGLGLPMCRRIVSQLGGSLSLDSQLGVGTRATVRLPLAGTPAS